jgi:hypothetical protein
MKRKSEGEKVDELRPEYDLAELLKDGAQGKYAKRYHEGTNLVVLDPDIARAFPSDAAVNETLRLVIQLTRLPSVGKEDPSQVQRED